MWLKNGEEFVYSMDATHAAIFFAPDEMKFRLLTDPDLGGTQTILGKSANAQSNAFAIMYYDNDVQWAVAAYAGAGLNERTTLAVPAAQNFRLTEDGLFVFPREPHSPLAALDWRRAAFRRGLDRFQTSISWMCWSAARGPCCLGGAR